MTERLSSEALASATVHAFKVQAEFYRLRSEALLKNGHSLKDPHDDAATYKRVAEVYKTAAEKFGVTLKQFRRDLERAMNPYFKDYSDSEIDLIIERSDEALASINDHHGAMT